MYVAQFFKSWDILSKEYQRYMEENLLPSLTDVQLTVLEITAKEEILKPSDLLPYLSTSPAAITTLVARMEKNGLLDRTRDEEDRRIVWITLTDKGKEELIRGQHIRETFISDVLNRISLHNQQILVYLFDRMTRN